MWPMSQTLSDADHALRSWRSRSLFSISVLHPGHEIAHRWVDHRPGGGFPQSAIAFAWRRAQMTNPELAQKAGSRSVTATH